MNDRRSSRKTQLQGQSRRPGRAIALLRRLLPQDRKRHIGRLIQQFEQRAGGTARLTLALLPVAYRFDRHADAGGKLGLREASLRPYLSGVASVDLRRPSRLD